jgi:hypothetical protein
MRFFGCNRKRSRRSVHVRCAYPGRLGRDQDRWLNGLEEVVNVPFGGNDHGCCLFVNGCCPQLIPARSRSHETTHSIPPMSHISRDKPKHLPERATIFLYVASWGKGREKPLLTFGAVTAFVIYPEWSNLITSTLIEPDGAHGDKEMCASMGCREGWILPVPGESRETLR